LSGTFLRRAVGLAVTAAALAATGCGGGDASQTPSTRVLKIVEKDFKVVAPKAVTAGTAVLVEHNRGPVDHELLVVRSDGKPLPLRSDGITVDEDRIEPRSLGEIEALEPGEEESLRVQLKPGRYELFCNMAGHYLGGMHAVLVVR
jgi:uncharacterized cupredoxin-like copper-binding protein